MSEEKGTKIWKIRRISDGKFSNGGSTPYFSKIGNGKVWKEKHHLTRHLGQLRGPRHYEGCEIVEYTITETNIETIADVLTEISEKKTKKEQENQKRWAKQEEAEARRQYEALQRRFGE